MSGELYKNLIDKILADLKINPSTKEKSIKRPDNEAVVVKEELINAISGDKMFGDMPGLQIEEDGPMYQDEGISPEILENNNNNINPLEGIEVIIFYLMNRDLVSKITSYSHSKIDSNRKFKTLEDAAIYLLKQQKFKFSKDDIDKQVKELIMLNSIGDETTIDKKITSALENINKGNINYVAYDTSKTAKQDIEACKYYANIGLTNNMCSLAETIPLNEILTPDIQQDEIFNTLTTLNEFNGTKNDDDLFWIKNISDILTIIAILPLSAKNPMQAGIKSVNNILKSDKEISGTELLKMFYNTQNLVIKSGIGQFNDLSKSSINSNTSNTLPFEDIIKNPKICKNSNNSALEKLHSLLYYEIVKTIIKQNNISKLEDTEGNNEIEKFLNNFNTLKNISIRSITENDGSLKYLIRYSGNTFKVKSIGDILAISLSLLSSEINSTANLLISQGSPDGTNNKTNVINSKENRLTPDGNALKIDQDEIKAQLFECGVKFKHICNGKFPDKGIFICKVNNKYLIEIPAKDLSGKSFQLIYNSDGRLKLEKTEFTNNNTHVNILRMYANNQVKQEFSTVTAENKVISASEKTADKSYRSSEYFYKDGILSKTIENTNRKDALTEYPSAITMKKTSYISDFIDIYEYTYSGNSKYAKTIVIIDNEQEQTVIHVNHNGTAINNKGYSVDINEILQDIETKNGPYDSVQALKFQNIPDGYYYNKEKNELTKIDTSKIKTEILGNEKYGEIKLLDENKYQLGRLLYKQTNDETCIHIYDFDTCTNDVDINSKLIEELLKLAQTYNKDVITTYQGKLNIDSQNEPFDLKSYYKMGFLAEDSGTDRLIRKCLTKEVPIPAYLTKFSVLKYMGDITPSKQLSFVSIQNAHKEFEKFINNKIDDTSLKIAIDKGYFSSSKGTEVLKTFYDMFSKQGETGTNDELNIILSYFDIKNFDRAKKRGLLDKMNINNVKQINILASYTDKQFNRIIKFIDTGIEYISENDDISRLAVKYVKSKTGYCYSQDEIEEIILQVKDPQKLADIVDELIKVDNSVVKNLLKNIKDPKFIAENLTNLSALNAKLYLVSDKSATTLKFNSEICKHKDICEKLYSNKNLLSTILDIDISGKYTDIQLYEIGIRINNSNADFIKKLALSNSVTADEVIKILNSTKALIAFSDSKTLINDSAEIETYNALLTMPNYLKSVCKDCGLDIDFEVQNLYEKLSKNNKLKRI